MEPIPALVHSVVAMPPAFSCSAVNTCSAWRMVGLRSRPGPAVGPPVVSFALLLTLTAMGDLCDAIGVTAITHPAIRRGVRGAERDFCVAVAGFLQGRTGDSFLLPLAGHDPATLVFLRRLSARAAES